LGGKDLLRRKIPNRKGKERRIRHKNPNAKPKAKKKCCKINIFEVLKFYEYLKRNEPQRNL